MKDIRVLLVDDEEEFTSALAERLNLRGIRTGIANSGEDGLRMIEADPPRVVLLDMLMPGLSGMKMLGRIRAAHPEIAVIFLTGRGSPDTGEALPDVSDACDYLMKPVNIDELVRKIHQAAARQAGV